MTSKSYYDVLRAFPEGTCDVEYMGRRWHMCKETGQDGRRIKLFAEACDGSDFVSLNLYVTGRGLLLRPCEMPAEKVIAFILDARP